MERLEDARGGQWLKKRGIGMALSMHTTGFGTSTTLVRINNDGTVHVNCSAEDIGQGIKTATAMSVAEVLGVRYEDVSLTEDNTKYNPRGGGVYGSKGTPTNIGASINAAGNARAMLLERAAVLMQAKPEEFDVRDGIVFIKSDPEIDDNRGCRRRRTVRESRHLRAWSGNIIPHKP